MGTRLSELGHLLCKQEDLTLNPHKRLGIIALACDPSIRKQTQVDLKSSLTSQPSFRFREGLCSGQPTQKDS